MVEGDAGEMLDLTARLAQRYSATAEDYARLWSPVVRPLGERLLRELPLATARVVLDIGTGVGGLVPALRQAAPRALVVGLDRSEGMLRLARRQVGVPLALMDAQRLGLRPARADAAVLAFCLFRLFDPLQGLREALHVLRPGGAIGLATWGREERSPADQVWTEELERAGAERDPDQLIARHALMDTPEKLRALLERAGFTAARAWAERFEQPWDLHRFLAIRASCGRSRQRLDSLAPAARDLCLRRVRERLATLPAEAFTQRPEVVFAVARRPSG